MITKNHDEIPDGNYRIEAIGEAHLVLYSGEDEGLVAQHLDFRSSEAVFGGIPFQVVKDPEGIQFFDGLPFWGEMQVHRLGGAWQPGWRRLPERPPAPVDLKEQLRQDQLATCRRQLDIVVAQARQNLSSSALRQLADWAKQQAEILTVSAGTRELLEDAHYLHGGGLPAGMRGAASEMVQELAPLLRPQEKPSAKLERLIRAKRSAARAGEAEVAARIGRQIEETLAVLEGGSDDADTLPLLEDGPTGVIDSEFTEAGPT